MTSPRAAHSLSRPTFTSSVTGFGVLGERSLICQQAITTVGGLPAHAPRVDGLVSSGWTGARHPGVTQHGLFFQRAYVYATPRATPWTRVAIESPTTARLFYVSSSEWSGQEPLRPLVVFDPGAGVNAVLFQHCGGHPQRYFGGLITPRP